MNRIEKHSHSIWQFILTLVLYCLISTISFGQESLEFSSEEIDFGTVDAKVTKSATASITFQNTGTSPVIITKLEIKSKNIRCTYPKTSIAPNAKGKLSFTWNNLDSLLQTNSDESIWIYYKNTNASQVSKEELTILSAKICVKNAVGPIDVKYDTSQKAWRGCVRGDKSFGGYVSFCPEIIVGDDCLPTLAFSFLGMNKYIRTMVKLCEREDVTGKLMKVLLANNETLTFDANISHALSGGTGILAVAYIYSFDVFSSNNQVADLSKEKRIAYALKQLRTYDIKEISIGGAVFKNEEPAYTAVTYDAICKKLEIKTGKRDLFYYDHKGSSTQSGSTRTTTTTTTTTPSSSTTPRPATTQPEHTASVEDVKVLHNQTVDGEVGMKITMKVTISGARQRPCEVAAYFYNNSGEPLKDSNKRYCSTDGEVSTGKKITPSYDSSVWKDFELFIPYSELHLRAQKDYIILFDVSVWDNSKEKRAGETHRMVRSEKFTTTFSIPPTAKFNNVWVSYDMMQGFSKGMVVHANMDVNMQNNKTCTMSVKFYRMDNKTKLMNSFGSHIVHEMTFVPNYDYCHWEDFQIFVPYSMLYYAVDRSGWYTFDVEIYSSGGKLLKRRENLTLRFM